MTWHGIYCIVDMNAESCTSSFLPCCILAAICFGFDLSAGGNLVESRDTKAVKRNGGYREKECSLRTPEQACMRLPLIFLWTLETLNEHSL